MTLARTAHEEAVAGSGPAQVEHAKGRRQTDHPEHLLLIEDDSEFRALIVAHLKTAGFEVSECASGFEFVSGLDTWATSPRPVDLIISDIRVPGLTGLEIVEGLRALKIDVPVIFMTAYGDEATHLEARRLNAAGTFDKPFDVDDLVTAVQMILGTRPAVGVASRSQQADPAAL